MTNKWLETFDRYNKMKTTELYHLGASCVPLLPVTRLAAGLLGIFQLEHKAVGFISRNDWV